ncbi:MAG: glycoside hydrolase family 15 protein [Acidimicrobiia bacterium]|nr:glycoside hydrolase family 15 protein [Acidimicrobiia bacterium]
MPSRIEQYALIGDTQTAALVGDDGSIDWLCAPRFDSPACFAALLGTPDHGRWLLAPAAGGRATRRRYRDGTLVLESEFETPDGAVRVTECMPIHDTHVDVVRLVEGLRGQVQMHTELTVRFDYGSTIPWVRTTNGVLDAIAGPDALALHSPIELNGADLRHRGEFTVNEGDAIPFVLTWYPSHHDRPHGVEARRAIAETTAWWLEWSSRSTYEGEWAELVNRSAITLKALTFAPTGGIIAAATTSLPECIGGVRNWDYRYCWLRDATFSLYALISVGYVDEARRWRDWLVRAVAGTPEQFQIMYGPAGERRLTELELPWLPGYEGSAPVRIGNAATLQFQLDVYGEVADAFHATDRAGVAADPDVEPLQQALLDFLTDGWREPDEGIWEVRGPRQHFTHSKVMAWVAFDRAVKGIEAKRLDWDLDKATTLRDAVHAEVCAEGFDAERGSFVQSFGSKALDASLLMIPLVGFLPPDDPRVVGTVDAIERELMRDGFVQRYLTDDGVDGLPPGEGVFLPCSFWLADNLALMGRMDEARALFERLVALCNDVGLISEEYDPSACRLLGNFPQAMTHVALINTACNLSGTIGPARSRSGMKKR